MKVQELIEAYQADKVSTYHKLRHHVRQNQKSLLRRMVAAHGDVDLSTIKHRTLIEWHMNWSGNGSKLSMGHQFIAMLRTLCNFGASILEEEQCERVALVLHRIRFPNAPPRSERLTADQADAIRQAARHRFGWPSIALGQAMQFELLLRQKDIVGEWVPFNEPGDTDVKTDTAKWLRGVRWDEIDENLILRHKTSKRQKVLEIDLKLAPMVVEELQLLIGDDPLIAIDGTVNRPLLPSTGPIMICDINGLPWTGNEYRRKWRKVAKAAGVPAEVRNMDSRAGGITEATEAGANIEHVKHAATHSDIAQTQHYSRGAAGKIAEVQKARAQHRDKFRHNS